MHPRTTTSRLGTTGFSWAMLVIAGCSQATDYSNASVTPGPPRVRTRKADRFVEPTVKNADGLIGLSVEDATQLARQNGWTIRVSRKDGRPLAQTMDLCPRRLNVEVTDGVVATIFGFN